MARSFKLEFPKIKLTPTLLRIAYHIIDVEASGEAAQCGGRSIEYSFVLSKLVKRAPSKVLDVGCASSVNILPSTLTRMGWEVYGIDLRQWNFRSSGFHFILGDVRHIALPNGFFDYAYDVSAIEHVGIAGRYGITKDDPEGDMKEVREVFRLLRPGGSFLVTMPYDVNPRTIGSLGRIYSRSIVSRLFSDWEIRDREVWALDEEGVWIRSDDTALAEKEHKDVLLLVELVKPS